jgi:hypothetical protein
LSPCVDSNELDLVQSLPRRPAACGSCRSDRQHRATWREIGRSGRVQVKFSAPSASTAGSGAAAATAATLLRRRGVRRRI